MTTSFLFWRKWGRRTAVLLLSPLLYGTMMRSVDIVMNPMEEIVLLAFNLIDLCVEKTKSASLLLLSSCTLSVTTSILKVPPAAGGSLLDLVRPPAPTCLHCITRMSPSTGREIGEARCSGDFPLKMCLTLILRKGDRTL